MRRWISYLMSFLFTIFSMNGSYAGSPAKAPDNIKNSITRHVLKIYNTAAKSHAGMLAIFDSNQVQDKEFLAGILKEKKISSLPRVSLAVDGAILIPVGKKNIRLEPLNWHQGLFSLNKEKFKFNPQASFQKNFYEIQKVLNHSLSAKFDWLNLLIPKAEAQGIGIVEIYIGITVVAIIGAIFIPFAANAQNKHETLKKLNDHSKLCMDKLSTLNKLGPKYFDGIGGNDPNNAKTESFKSEVFYALATELYVRPDYGREYGEMSEADRKEIFAKYKEVNDCAKNLLANYQDFAEKAGKKINLGKFGLNEIPKFDKPGNYFPSGAYGESGRPSNRTLRSITINDSKGTR